MSDNEKPLVTFALFAYNQEQYIREAVEGAFAQTYEPLEIILSDDCSSDRTFEIMQEMAATYEGPHEVRVRRQQDNSGVLAHLLCTAREASGEVFVVAAGDDISLPERTVILASQFGSDDIYGVSSDDIIIDGDGIVREWSPDRITQRDIWHAQSQTWFHGATAAYRTCFLKRMPLTDSKVFNEDFVFQDVLQLLNKKSIRIQNQLIKYRHHLKNLSNRRMADSSAHGIESANKITWLRLAEAKRYCVKLVSKLDADVAVVALELPTKWLREERFFRLLSDWDNLSLLEKAALFWVSLGIGKIHVALPRLFGVKIFFLLKRLKAQIV